MCSMVSNLEKLQRYYDEQVSPCNNVLMTRSFRHFFNYKKLRLYGISDRAQVLIIGHSPPCKNCFATNYRYHFGLK